jgi:serine/threonine-protein phosphatase 5
MFINRGNHEAKEMNRTYGFEGEAKHKHGEQSYKVCTSFKSMFTWLTPIYKLFAHVFTTCELAINPNVKLH